MEPIPVAQKPVSKPISREERFVERTLKLCTENKGAAARLRRADNPATEYQSWEFLAGFGLDITREYERLPYLCVAAAIAKAKAQTNGTQSLGRAIATCYEDGNSSEQAKARLRRLLACEDLPELCRILRPLFALIDSKGGQALDYIRLLKQLTYYNKDTQRIRAQWAQDFYGYVADQEQSA